MPEYDAFGREIGEDTLAPWREGAAAPPPQPQPSRAPAQAAPPRAVPPRAVPPQASPPRRPRVTRRGRRRGARLGVLLIVGWAAVNGISYLADEVEDAARTIDIPSLSPPAPAEQPAGLAPGSLLRPAAFERALAEIRRRDIGRIENLRVAPERIDASLLTPRGTIVSVQVPAGGELRRFSESGPGFQDLDTIPYGRLDRRVPQRLVRAAAERLGRPVSRIDYLVPSISQGKLGWGAYFKGGAIFLADARGRILRRVS